MQLSDSEEQKTIGRAGDLQLELPCPSGSGPRVRWLLAFLVCIGLAGCQEAPPDVGGYGGVPFASSLASLESRVSGLKPHSVKEGAAFAFYRAENQSFGALSPCTTIFGFVADKLYEVRFQCQEAAAVPDALRRYFGDPESEEDGQSIWRPGSSVVTMNHTTRDFAVANRALSDEAHRLILELATRGVLPFVRESRAAVQPPEQP